MTDKHSHRPPPRSDRLSRLPPLAVFLGTLVIALGAFFTPGLAGAVLVGLIAVGVALLLVAAWRRDTPAVRALRLLVFGVLVVIAISKLS